MNKMQEYSRIIIEEYCRKYPKTKKAAFLRELLELSYTMDCEPEEWVQILLEWYTRSEIGGTFILI